jgi:hypothetical protein
MKLVERGGEKIIISKERSENQEQRFPFLSPQKHRYLHVLRQNSPKKPVSQLKKLRFDMPSIRYYNFESLKQLSNKNHGPKCAKTHLRGGP